MGRSFDSGTHVTLLGRLRREPGDPAAWAEFVEQYGRRIYRWCLRWQLQEADAEDVTQNVLLKMAEKLRTFTYDPERSFRAWLKTLTHHAWQDYLTSQRRAGQGSGDSAVCTRLESTAARDDLVEQLEEAFDHELLQHAMARVRLRVEPRTWDAFRLLALENLSGAAAADQLGMKVASLFAARSKVQRLIREEVAKLGEGG